MQTKGVGKISRFAINVEAIVSNVVMPKYSCRGGVVLGITLFESYAFITNDLHRQPGNGETEDHAHFPHSDANVIRRHEQLKRHHSHGPDLGVK
jgi:hypothetical protein